MSTQRFRVIDSHTGGEPTRTIVEGGPVLGGTVLEQLALLRDHWDRYRRAVVNEPRGSDVMVGAMLVPPIDPECCAGVIFFNNVGYLGMCGHGTIGVVETLRFLGRIGPGTHRFETPVGDVQAVLHEDGNVSIDNVPSYREHAAVEIDVAGIGRLEVDIAFGGNWFCLVECPDPKWLDRDPAELLSMTQEILASCRVDFPMVDHVELFGQGRASNHHSRNFVLCPGGAYDRSPCGTGTSAKLACLAADGKLAEGETWLQESFIGSLFQGSYRWVDRSNGIIAPRITGRAHVNGDLQVIVADDDPFAWGIGH